MQERRSVVRRACRALARYKLEENPTAHTAFLSNFSSKGVCFASSQAIPSGSVVAISLPLYGSDYPLLVKGIIRWFSKPSRRRDKFCYGVEFFGLDETSLSRLDSDITQLLTLSKVNLLTFLKDKLFSDVSKKFWLITGVVFLGIMLVWIFMLQRSSLQLYARLNEQSLMISNLKSKQVILNSQLEQAQKGLDTSSKAVLQLESEHSGLENEIARLSSSLEQVSNGYINLKFEREALQLKLSQLEAEQLKLGESVRTMLDERDMPKVRRLKSFKFGSIKNTKAQKLEDLTQGNKGFLIWNGRPTSTDSKLSIRVYDPQEEPANIR